MGRVGAVKRFGDQAQVHFRGDTTFLAEFPQGWKVVGVGYSSRAPLPYDCQVKR